MSALLLAIAVLIVRCTPVASEGSGTAAAPAPANPATPSSPADGTRRMAERLERFAASSDPEVNPFLNEERLALFSAATPPEDAQGRLSHDARIANELLNTGRSVEAAEAFGALLRRVEEEYGLRGSKVAHDLKALIAISWLRAGEQDNCIDHHTSDSCILPIRDAGVHRRQRGSREAIETLTSMLEQQPDDLKARWLLNVAYMTLGEYPESVPPAWLIPPSAFESDYDIGRFPDVAAKVGLAVQGLAGAALMDDFDGDHYLDLFVTSWGLRDSLRFFHNEGDGTFTERTEKLGLEGVVSGLNAVHADYDNDGDFDVFVPRGAWLRQAGQMPPSLLRNRGDGSFDDVTEQAGLLGSYSSQAAAWGDYDNDGFVDLYVATESVTGGPTSPTMLYHNNGDGTFTDVARQVGVAALGFFKGVVWGDYDNDGRLDLYLTAIQHEPANILFHNDGPDANGRYSFSDVTERAGVLGPEASFPSWFFDYDNDGWLDLFVSAYAGTVADIASDYLGRTEWEDGQTPRLYRNRGDGTFEDVTRKVGLETVLMTMGCNFGDLDNDGWLDFYAGTGNPDFQSLVPNRMFRNDRGQRFQDVTTSGGFGHLQKGHGVAFGDIDNDGDQDVYLKVGGAYIADGFRSALFENPGHGHRWVTLELVGVKSNRAAIGARLALDVETPTGTRRIHTTVTSGSSFGASSLRQEIGLGDAVAIRRATIRWPSGTEQVLADVPMERVLEIREGSAEPVELPLRRFVLGGSRPN